MSRLPSSPVTIIVSSTANLRPRYLIWNHHRFEVDQIVDLWRVDTDWWTDVNISRQYVSLITPQGAMLVIYFDFLTQQWCLEQAYD